MNEDNYLLVSLNDSRTKNLAEVLQNKTSKIILDYLVENKEASQKDLSIALKIPLNTVDYNIKKLLESGLIQKRKNFFWSKKGKKIVMYELSNKSIIISPRKSSIDKLKSILPAMFITGAVTFAVYVYEKIFLSKKIFVENSSAAELAFDSIHAGNSLVGYGGSSKILEATVNQGQNVLFSSPNMGWIFFLSGAFLALLIVLIINWKKL